MGRFNDDQHPCEERILNLHERSQNKTSRLDQLFQASHDSELENR